MSTFLAQLATLRDFLKAWGFHVEDNSNNNHYHYHRNTSIGGNKKKPTISERELRETLQSCGYNVESALERFISRLSSGNDDRGGRGGADNDSRSNGENDLFGNSSGSYARAVGGGIVSAAATTTPKASTSLISSCSTSSSAFSMAPKSEGNLTATSPFETPIINTNKRMKISHCHGDSGFATSCARQEESSSNVVGGDGDFLSGLLIKFRNASNGMIASASGESTFAMQVAETISKCVQSSDEFLKSECPICLEEPRVVDAVYTPCAHMFCRDCLLSVFQEQVIRSKDTKVTNAPTVEGGNCPVCHDSVKMSSIIQISKSVNGQAVSKFLEQPRPGSKRCWRS